RPLMVKLSPRSTATIAAPRVDSQKVDIWLLELVLQWNVFAFKARLNQDQTQKDFEKVDKKLDFCQKLPAGRQSAAPGGRVLRRAAGYSSRGRAGAALKFYTHVTLTPVNPDGQQQSSSVSSGFVSNMLNPNQDTGVDIIFGHNAEATSQVDIPVTAIAEPSFFTPTNRPPTPTPLFTQIQQPPILTPTSTPSSSFQNLPDFALYSVLGIIDQYLANKMKEAVDDAVQLKSDSIREEAQAENKQFLNSIDEGMKKVIKEQVKSEVSKITPQIEKLVNEQLESEVLVQSSKEAKTSHAVAANLSELELKKILIDKMEASKSINRSNIQMKLYKALVDAYEAEKILLDTYGDTVTLKRP
ncbi:hypothetical protein Tco_1014229, partial [Tanacetum coccineum]